MKIIILILAIVTLNVAKAQNKFEHKTVILDTIYVDSFYLVSIKYDFESSYILNFNSKNLDSIKLFLDILLKDVSVNKDSFDEKIAILTKKFDLNICVSHKILGFMFNKYDKSNIQNIIIYSTDKFIISFRPNAKVIQGFVEAEFFKSKIGNHSKTISEKSNLYLKFVTLIE
jgi:hypothetical protein